MNRFYFFFISALSLLTRAVYSYHSWYIRDQARVFDLGFQIYHNHILPIQGSPIVYTNSLLPGSLQAILASIPLYLSGGNPFSIILFVQFLNFISCLIIYKIFSNLFINLNKYYLFPFIVLNPMNIIFSYGWNPSFIIIFSSLFFLGLVKVCDNRNSKIGLFLVFFPHLLIMQLNLQFLILAVLTFVLILRKIIPLPPFRILILSIFPGMLTLFPFILNRIFHQNISGNNWNMNGNIFSNIQFHFKNLFSYFHVLARFLSFSTGETTRNLGHHYIKMHPEMWLFFMIGMIGTAFIFVTAVLFYIDKNKWKIFFKSTQSMLLLEKLDLILLYIPIIASVLFIFSVTPPTTHKIWSLFPFCFYPFFRVLCSDNVFLLAFKRKFQFIYSNQSKIIPIYIASVLIYSSIGGTTIPTNFSQIYKESKIFCNTESEKEIGNYLNQLDNSTKEYTMSLMCQYWNSNK